MKAFKKVDLASKEQVDNALTEGRILGQLDHPFIVKLLCTFESSEKLFYVLEYCPGGELFFYLQHIGRFKESAAKFYAANILLALRHMHSNNILYRDLKPENVIISLTKEELSEIAKTGQLSTLNKTIKTHDVVQNNFFMPKDPKEE